MPNKKKQKAERVVKPFIRGRMIDRTTPLGALKFFGFTVLMTFVYFVSMMLSSIDSQFLSILINGAILFTTWLIFWQSGMASGADGVSQGEILYHRKEKDRPVADWEVELCYHPLKGLMVALLGSIPIVLICLVFALITKRQMTYIGVMQDWTSPLMNRQDIGAPLAYYTAEAKLSAESILRVVNHVIIMPWLSIFGPEDKDVVLLLERLSPALTLIPALSYGLGYALGTEVRAAVHGNVALGKKKLKKKQQKELRARRNTAHRGPEKLN